MDSFKTMKQDVERGKVGEQAKKVQQEFLDIARIFNKVFGTEEGKKALEHLDEYSHKNFPNYEHTNAVLCTYSKIGEQALVKYIKSLIKLSKKE